MNSSSSPPPLAAPLQTRHNVFLSFRGEDTGDAFTSHLHAALLRNKIETYMDRRLEKGDEIGPAHMEAIEKSKISVVIFSKNYASSAWCLKELVHIVECKKRDGQIVIPIFYGIDPSYVQEKKGAYGLASCRLKKRLKGNMDEVPYWRDALEEAANMSGFYYSSKSGRSEADFVETVVREVLAKLNHELSSDLRGPFEIESKIEKIQTKHDVFLSFRGEDTRDTFTSHLHAALLRKNIETYIDYRLEKGDDLGPALLEAIEKSKIALVIFSKDYASSTWCLKELVHILGCKKSYGQIVMPIFYLIDPSDLRKEKGTYALAINELQKSFKGSTDEVVNWRKALKKAANMSGFPYSSKTGRTEAHFHNGLHQLRNKLVGEILKQGVNIDTPSIPLHIQNRLKRTKALIVLDDVNARKQLEDLVGDDDRFCQGSRIIITARDKGLLGQKIDQAKIYNVEGLGSDEALELFHSHAFGNKAPTTDHPELSREVVDYIKGIPLALKVMGSSFRRCKSKQEWEVQWKKVKRVPIGEIQEVLRVSYDGLDDNEKEIFLDIACFHKGYMRNDVERILDSCDFFGETGINDLIDRSLISISKEGWSKGQIEMHDLVQEMGRAIAREQWSRLFNDEDVYQVLTNNERDGHVQAISFDEFEIEKLPLELEHLNFEKMYQLRFLRVSYYLPSIVSLDLPNSLKYLSWDAYPLKSLPSKFSAKNVVYLRMLHSEVGGQLWNEDQRPVNLKWIDLRECEHLTEVPNLSRSRKIEHIDLHGCQSLVEIPSYFQHLSKLTYLDLGSCTNLKNLPEMPCNLEFLDLYGTAIEELPSSVWSHEKISHLDITYCKHLKSLPSNTCKLKLSGSLSLIGCKSLCEFWELPTNTRVLDLRFQSNFVSLPTNIWKLKSLERLELSWCPKFQYFPEISEAVETLEFLNLFGTAVREVPPSIGNLVALRNLDLGHCNNLEVVPDDLFCITSLQELNLSGTKIKSLPASIKQAAQLSRLRLRYCKSLESLPELPPLLQHLDVISCTSLKTVSSSSTAITQGWEEYIFSRGLHEKRIFSHCPKLDVNARSNIMGDAQLRIMRMATASSKFKKDKIEQPSYDSDNSYDDYEESLCERSFVAISCPGNEIPNWFSHKSEGCSINIELPRDWFSTDFLGFALSLVVAYKRCDPRKMKIGCKYNFKTSNGESHEVNHPLYNLFETTNVFENGDSHEVYAWWYNNVFEEVLEGARSPTAFYNLFTQVNVDFNVLTYYDKRLRMEAASLKVRFGGLRKASPAVEEVEKCGICLLYGKDAEMIKQRAL